MTSDDIMAKLAAIALSGGLLCISIAVRRFVGSWAAPGAVFCLLWFLYTFVPLVLVFPAPIGLLPILYIVILLAAFASSTIFFDWRTAMRENAISSRLPQYDTKAMRWVFAASGLLALVFLIANSYRQQITIGEIFSNIFTSSAQYADRRYSGAIVDNWFMKLSNLASYMAASTGGFIYRMKHSKKRQAYVLILSFTPSLFVMLTQSARGMLFLAMSLFAAAQVVTHLANPGANLIRRGLLARLMGGVLVIVPCIVVSFIAKGLYDVQDTAYVGDRLLHAFTSYVSGHLYAFADWFTYYIGGNPINLYVETPDRANGFYTFMALFKLLGNKTEVPPGVFEEYFTYGGYVTSNIYTMFRGLILDFGLIGSVIFMFVSGLVLNACFYWLLVARGTVVWVATYVCAMGYYYTSFIISIMIWNSIFVTFVALCLLLWIDEYLSGRKYMRERRHLAPSVGNHSRHSRTL